MVQEARLKHAMADLNKAQAQLDDKQKELDAVQALYDSAVNEKQVYQAPLLPQGKNCHVFAGFLIPLIFSIK